MYAVIEYTNQRKPLIFYMASAMSYTHRHTSADWHVKTYVAMYVPLYACICRYAEGNFRDIYANLMYTHVQE